MFSWLQLVSLTGMTRMVSEERTLIGIRRLVIQLLSCGTSTCYSLARLTFGCRYWHMFKSSVARRYLCIRVNFIPSQIGLLIYSTMSALLSGLSV